MADRGEAAVDDEWEPAGEWLMDPQTRDGMDYFYSTAGILGHLAGLLSRDNRVLVTLARMPKRRFEPQQPERTPEPTPTHRFLREEATPYYPRLAAAHPPRVSCHWCPDCGCYHPTPRAAVEVDVHEGGVGEGAGVREEEGGEDMGESRWEQWWTG